MLGAFIEAEPTRRHGLTQTALLKGDVKIEYIKVIRADFERNRPIYAALTSVWPVDFQFHGRSSSSFGFM